MKIYSFDRVKTSFEKFLSSISNVLTNKDEIVTIQNKLRRHFNTTTPDYLCSEEFQALLRQHQDVFEEKNSSTKYFTRLAAFDEQLKKHSTKSSKSAQLSNCTSLINLDSTVETPALEIPSEDGQLMSVVRETMEHLLDQCDKIPSITKVISIEQRAIMKLERRLNNLSRLIRKLEKEDMSLDEMANCDLYAVESRLKEEACQVYKELAELKKQSASTKRILHQPITLDESETGHPLINKDLQDMVNQSINFPSFSDVLKTVTKANDNYKLNLTDEVKQNMAEKSFRSIGNMIKTRRMADFQDIMSSRLPKNFDIEQNDPALDNPEIENVLLENQREAVKKTEQILEEYSRIAPDPDDVIDTEDRPEVETESDMVVESSGTVGISSIASPEPSDRMVLETESTIEIELNDRTFTVLSTASLPDQKPSSSTDVEGSKVSSSLKRKLSDNEIIYKLYERRLTNYVSDQPTSIVRKRLLPKPAEYSIVKKHKQPELIVLD